MTGAGRSGAYLAALESSGRVGGAALARDGELLGEVQIESGLRHGAGLLSALARVLAECGVRPRDLGAVAVSVGPGSWTGLRIGLSAAKSLAWALSAELIEVDSLEAQVWRALREGVGGKHVLLVPCLDARGGEVFCAGYFVRDEVEGRLECAWPAQALPATGLVARIEQACFGAPCVILGEGARFPDGGDSGLPTGVRVAQGDFCPHPADVAILASRQRAVGQAVFRGREIHGRQPRYLKGSGRLKE